MQKLTSVLLGALVVVTVGLVIWQTGPRGGGENGRLTVAPPPSGALPRTDAGAGEAELDLAILDDPSFDGIGGARPGAVLLSGEAPPALPAGAVQSVRFAVILIQYRGAQRASVMTRSKEEALKLAKEIRAEAEKDFKRAVERGDSGSSENAGWMPRGVLEPAPNYVLFSLKTGQVGGPVDTPTGYWVIKNLGK